MSDVKVEEIIHRPMDQLQGFEYCIDSNPSWGEAFLLGFQHYILALGTAVMIPTFLVPLMGGSDHDKVRVVQTLLFVGGINTLLQTLFGTRLPTVIGGSYGFIIPTISIIHDSSFSHIPDDHERFLQTIRAIQGAVIVSSSIQIILGYSQLWGICSRFFSPLGMVPVVALVGFGLFYRGFPVVGRCVEIGVPTLILFIALSQKINLESNGPTKRANKGSIPQQVLQESNKGTEWLEKNIPSCCGTQGFCCFGRASGNHTHVDDSATTGGVQLQYLKHLHVRRLPLLERFALLITVAILWAYAHILTVSGAYRHRPERTQIHCRTDRANLISSAPWVKIPYPLQWGAPTFDAGHAFGMMAAVFVSLIESTGAYKAAARLASATPPPAHVLSRGIGWQGNLEHYLLPFQSPSLLQFTASYLGWLVAAVGLSFLQFTNMNSMRSLFITGVSIFLGLSIPEYFFSYTASANRGPAHTKAEWFNDYMNTIFSSPATVGLIVSVFLDNTLELKESARDRGMPWWVRFRTFKGDSRNEEFYTLPFNLNRFFPPS
ncbi:Nucleobase-ascorbate transporter 2 [Apostasia shenzhenica]|uniref:Nucleobase-ascorbate transporter 2 n=1 Tax=Apostasia shenzhenica TaxID=1088818 RepID=A0A2I0AZU1_9ASPA|nr:Nucleobase-ascorbate transporter 2 [Apostasia shenzhenica]